MAEGGPVGGSCPPHPLSGREQSGGLLACRGTRPPSRGAWPLGGAETSAGRPGRFGAPPRLCGEHGPGGRGCTSSRAGGRSVRCCRPPLCRWPLPRPHPGRWVAGDRGCPSLQCRILPKATVIQTQAKLCPVSCSAPQLQMCQEARGWGQQEEHRDQRGSRLASQAPEGEACNPPLCCSWVRIKPGQPPDGKTRIYPVVRAHLE